LPLGEGYSWILSPRAVIGSKELKELKNKKGIAIHTQNLYYLSEPDGVGRN